MSPIASVCVCSDYFNVNDDGELCLNPGTMGLRQTRYFKEPGTFQFAKDDYPWLARVRVLVQGGGGGSAGANAASNECIVRPGAAGGGYAEAMVDASALGAVETIVVGAGGAAGTSNGAGGAGGTSSFGGYAVALGGDGSTAAQSSGTVPDAVQGTVGPFASSGDMASGGGSGAGGIRLSGTNGLSGQGGDSRLGHGGFPRTTDGPGTAPRGYGGGAGGALSLGDSQPGFDGGAGIVIIELYG
ncbi:glycine-rich domain-containing protein [Streptomyces smyrnaeus]|uniref:glycine-rich domain-containing protein n=1 Tax=Streptomyces smyrnaeus TaxID=1387713 RepID=UPI0036AC9007